MATVTFSDRLKSWRETKDGRPVLDFEQKRGRPRKRYFTTHTAKQATRLAPKSHHGYRCVYCRRGYVTVADLMSHEGSCDARYIRQRDWETQIARAKQRESTV